MLPALSPLIVPPTGVPIRPTPLLLEKGHYHGMSIQKLENLAATRFGTPRSWGLMLGLDLGVGNLETLLLAFLSSMSARHPRVARSVAARLRKARLYRLDADVGRAAASFARWSACSFPTAPWCAGTHLTVTTLPRASSRWASLMATIANSYPGPGASSVILLMAASVGGRWRE